MASRLTSIPDVDILAIALLVTTNPDNTPDLSAWAKEAHDLLMADINQLKSTTPPLT